MAEPRWDVQCHDPFGRDRALTVIVDHGKVVLVPPPGSSAVLSAQQTRRLRQALDQAAGRAGEP
ncbi:hypothetical protein ALI144C_14305 [Actinosynnema sp. ALI-1.44]|uniref:hypothetical protein n=1 Tax=Actinosynnema sp. ALI-1.44 TaxID=1933779 RepID=UPI00097C7645|nr:hypothetical protein [Actinosynnema sp. ALI-1.44]ONI84343.1 hypothetical protein ALI144C_14305 [Actinosynnema sp. ALI-1.44]